MYELTEDEPAQGVQLQTYISNSLQSYPKSGQQQVLHHMTYQAPLLRRATKIAGAMKRKQETDWTSINSKRRKRCLESLDSIWGGRGWLPPWPRSKGDAVSVDNAPFVDVSNLATISLIASKQGISLPSLWQPGGILYDTAVIAGTPSVWTRDMSTAALRLCKQRYPNATVQAKRETENRRELPLDDENNGDAVDDADRETVYVEPELLSIVPRPSQTPEASRKVAVNSLGQLADSPLPFGRSVESHSGSEVPACNIKRSLSQLLEDDHRRLPASMVSPLNDRKPAMRTELDTLSITCSPIRSGKVPDTFTKARTQLRNAEWLSDDTMELCQKEIIRRVRGFRSASAIVDRCIILDPLFLQLAQKLPKPPSQVRQSSIDFVLMPLHHQDPGHWTLAKFDLRQSRIQWYDPLPDVDRTRQVSEALCTWFSPNSLPFSFDEMVCKLDKPCSHKLV